MIYVNVDTPNLGFPYFNFLGGYQWEKTPCTTRYPTNKTKRYLANGRLVWKFAILSFQDKVTQFVSGPCSSDEKYHLQKTSYHNIVWNLAILTFQGKGDTICLRTLFIRRKPFAANGSFSRFNLFSSDQKFLLNIFLLIVKFMIKIHFLPPSNFCSHFVWTLIGFPWFSEEKPSKLPSCPCRIRSGSSHTIVQTPAFQFSSFGDVSSSYQMFLIISMQVLSMWNIRYF